MKNIHVLPTEKFSNLILQTNGELRLSELEIRGQVGNGFTQHIYITSDEEIKTGDYVLEIKGNSIFTIQIQPNTDLSKYKKIILTTDQDLIKDGVQSIDDEFLEWFVKNPSCESVEVERDSREVGGHNGGVTIEYGLYEIIIPKEEPKQETLEEFIQRQLSLGKYQDQGSAIRNSIELTAKWQQERMYSEEDLHNAFYNGWLYRGEDYQFPKAKKEWLNNLKINKL